ncbi:acyl--CoA ligase [Bradyrhizobium jicamae]|uniref:class I adenylate-forming enzyme family protein n=1 Tax=Bradyrhizobium jicamae TaxID=280332 RepID=UPI001BA807C4|nr:class I adenylate-forming enzyme family protein [Bradyrhizobium jicamae]MBR0754421.1 acyl--CoA ligase [Bradyrhizobium jicamae]
MRANDYGDICARLTAQGAPFEVALKRFGDQELLSWKRAPSTLRIIFESSRARGNKPFIVLEDERLSYADHYRLVARCAVALRDIYGIRKGDRVAIAMRNLPEWSIAFWAIVSIGAVSVSINAWMTGAEMGYCLADSGSRVLIADEERLERLSEFLPALGLEAVVVVRKEGGAVDDAVPWSRLINGAAEELPDVEVNSDDDATILYTSGTTGNPKGALGSHAASCNNAISTRFLTAVDRLAKGQAIDSTSLDGTDDSVLLTVPLFHAGGCQSGLIFTMFGGGRLVMLPRWDGAQALELIVRERITHLAAVPANYIQLLDLVEREQANGKLVTVRSVLVGAALPPVNLPARLRAVMPQAAIGTGYGQTECTQIATLSAGGEYIDHPSSCGRPIPICEIRIVNDQGDDVAAGEIGELLLRSPTLVKGYINRPEQTEEAFAGGWLRTGDLVHLDEEGRLYIDDRKKDMVIRGGENIYCIEVEQALCSHPDVEEAAVYGIPHPVLGEVPVATVYLRTAASASEEELLAHVSRGLAKFKVPVEVHLANAPLPRNANGKILKRTLRAGLVDGT